MGKGDSGRRSVRQVRERHEGTASAVARGEVRKFVEVLPARLITGGAWLLEWPLSATGMVATGPTVLVLASPRSGSTLLFDLLAWNAGRPREITGAAETKASYRTERDLRRLRVRLMLHLRTMSLTEMVADKIVEPQFEVSRTVLSDPRCRIIVLRRDPEATVASIQQRLRVTAEHARVLHDRRSAQLDAAADDAVNLLEVDYEALLAQPRATLDTIGRFLGLEYPLAEVYEVPRFSRKFAYGDDSARLATGRIQADPPTER